MKTTRIVRRTERLHEVVCEARSTGCIVHIDPISGRTVIRPHPLPGMLRINQIFYRNAA
jgi:hypothetical protein